MIYLIFEIFISLYKIIVVSFTNYSQLYIKLTVILILTIILIYYKTKPNKMLDKNGEELLQYYRIKNVYDKYFTIFMMLLYFNIFVLGFFYLRFLNKETSKNLPEIYDFVIFRFKNDPFLISLINTLLFILIILSVLVLLVKFKAIFKRYFIKFHLYHVRSIVFFDRYRKFRWFNQRYSYRSFIAYKLGLKYPDLMDYKILKFSLEYHMHVIIPRLHYIIIIFLLIYNLLFNGGTISLFYKYMPYIFLYKLYIDFCQLYDNEDLHYNSDEILYVLLYVKPVKLITEKEILFSDSSIVDLDNISSAVHIYLRFGLDGPRLYRYKEKTKVYPGDERCYYKDWNRYNNQT